MIIKRTGEGFCISIELSPMEVRHAYDEHERICKLEDIAAHLDMVDKDDLCGYSLQEILDNSELMGLMLQSFFKHESCELAENDVMVECIRTTLDAYAKQNKGESINV